MLVRATEVQPGEPGLADGWKSNRPGEDEPELPVGFKTQAVG